MTIQKTPVHQIESPSTTGTKFLKYNQTASKNEWGVISASDVDFSTSEPVSFDSNILRWWHLDGVTAHSYSIGDFVKGIASLLNSGKNFTRSSTNTFQNIGDFYYSLGTATIYCNVDTLIDGYVDGDDAVTMLVDGRPIAAYFGSHGQDNVGYKFPNGKDRVNGSYWPTGYRLTKGWHTITILHTEVAGGDLATGFIRATPATPEVAGVGTNTGWVALHNVHTLEFITAAREISPATAFYEVAGLHMATGLSTSTALKDLNADMVDNIHASQFIRNDIDGTFVGKMAVGDTAKRAAGMYGLYDPNKIGHIWSMGTAYTIDATGANFGNLYGFAYKHTSNTTGGAMGGGHMAVWASNGVPQIALGDNLWAKNNAFILGKLGVGMEDPTNALDVVGDARISTSGATPIVLKRTASSGNVNIHVSNSTNTTGFYFGGGNLASGAGNFSIGNTADLGTSWKVRIDAYSGDTTIAGTLSVTKATTLSDTLSVTKATTLSDTLSVTKATTLSDTLSVAKVATFSDDVRHFSNTNTKHFYFHRTTNLNHEYTKVGTDDGFIIFDRLNDEVGGGYLFRMKNDDTETGGGAGLNVSELTFYSQKDNTYLSLKHKNTDAGSWNSTWHIMSNGLASNGIGGPSSFQILNSSFVSTMAINIDHNVRFRGADIHVGATNISDGNKVWHAGNLNKSDTPFSGSTITAHNSFAFGNYGGGWHMLDSTWIRSSGSKSIYHDSGILRTDGTLQVGSGGSKLNVPPNGVPTIDSNTIWHAGNLFIGMRNLVGNNAYSPAVDGYQRTKGKVLVSGTTNRVNLSREPSYSSAASMIKSSATYTVAFWYKVENYVSGSSFWADINDVQILPQVSISGNIGWTRHVASATVNNYINTFGFLDFEGTFSATITVSDIVVVRGNSAPFEHIPAPEDFLRVDTGTSSQFLKGDGTLDSNDYFRIRDIDIDTQGNYISSRSTSGWINGAKPATSNNAFGVISTQLHSGNYYGQLGFSAATTEAFIRFQNNSTVWSAWDRVLTDKSTHVWKGDNSRKSRDFDAIPMNNWLESGVYRPSNTDVSLPSTLHLNVLHMQHPTLDNFAAQIGIPYAGGAVTDMYLRRKNNNTWDTDWARVWSSNNFSGSPTRSTADLNSASFINLSGFYAISNSNLNRPVGSDFSAMVSARNSDVGFQLLGGSTNDKLFYRGWSNNGTNFTAWRRLWHDGDFDATTLWSMDRITTRHTDVAVDLNTVFNNRGGAYHTYTTTNLFTNGPEGMYGIVQSIFGQTNIQAQFAYNIRHGQTNFGDMWFRTQNASGWATWRKMWHSGNLTNLSQLTNDLNYGTGTVSSVSVTSNDGITSSVANSTTTPAITLGLGNITPTSITTGNGTFNGTLSADRFKQLTNGVPSNNLGAPSVTEMALFQQQFDNKLWFYPTAQFVFEYTINGTTWIPHTLTTDEIKRFVSGGGENANIIIPRDVIEYRITIRNKNSYVYLNALYLYNSTQGNSMSIKIQKKRDDGSWIQHTNSDVTISSWPGHVYLPFDTIPWSLGTTAGHYNDIRIQFFPNWIHASNTIVLQGLEIWGGYPAGNRNIFTWDRNQNVNFPATISSAGNAVWHAGNLDTNKFISGRNGSGTNLAPTTWTASDLSQYKAGFWDVYGAAWTPDTGWWWGTTLGHGSNTASYNYGAQLIVRNSITSLSARIRTISNSVTSSWHELYHTGNLDPKAFSKVYTYNRAVPVNQMAPLGRFKIALEGTIQLLITVQSRTSGNSGTNTYMVQCGFTQYSTNWSSVRPLVEGRGHGDAQNGFDLLIRRVSTDNYAYEIAVAAKGSATTKNLFISIQDMNADRDVIYTDLSSDAMTTTPALSGPYYSHRLIEAEELNVQNSVTSTGVQGTVRISNDAVWGSAVIRKVGAAINYLSLGFENGTSAPTNAIAALAITRSGNVGINTTTPTVALDVAGLITATKGSSVFSFNEGNANLTPTISVLNTATGGKAAALIAGTSGAAFAFDSAGFFAIQAESKSTFTANTLGTGPVHMRIYGGTGNVMIGRSSDTSFKLDVAGTINAGGEISAPSLALSTSTGADFVKFGSGGGIYKMTDQNGLSIYSDSSMIVHAGDNGKTLVSDLGIVASTTSENLYLTADGEVWLINNRQTNYGTTNTLKFINNTLLLNGDTVYHSGNYSAMQLRSAITTAGGSVDTVTWTKIAEINLTSSTHIGYTVLFAITAGVGVFQSATVHVTARQYTSADAPLLVARIQSLTGSGSQLSDDSILITSNGFNTVATVYIKKYNPWGRFVVTRLSEHGDGSSSITFFNNQPLLTTEPAGTFKSYSNGLTYGTNKVWHTGNLTGTLNRLPKFTGTQSDLTIGNSIISDDGTTATVDGSISVLQTNHIRFRNLSNSGMRNEAGTHYIYPQEPYGNMEIAVTNPAQGIVFKAKGYTFMDNASGLTAALDVRGSVTIEGTNNDVYNKHAGFVVNGMSKHGLRTPSGGSGFYPQDAYGNMQIEVADSTKGILYSSRAHIFADEAGGYVGRLDVRARIDVTGAGNDVHNVHAGFVVNGFTGNGLRTSNDQAYFQPQDPYGNMILRLTTGNAMYLDAGSVIIRDQTGGSTGTLQVYGEQINYKNITFSNWMGIQSSSAVNFIRPWVDGDTWLRAGTSGKGIFHDATSHVFRGHDAGTLGTTSMVVHGTISGHALGVNNTSSSSGRGLSLYSGPSTGKPEYGIMFSGTATHGTHGAVTGDWATYFTMNGVNTRGWIFQLGTTNIASISATGTFSGSTLRLANTAASFNPAALTKNRFEIHISGVTAVDQAQGITWAAHGESSTVAQAGLYVQSSNVYGTKMYFATTNSYAAGPQTRMMIDHTGNIGVGLVTPTARMHIKGSGATSSTVALKVENSVGTETLSVKDNGEVTADGGIKIGNFKMEFNSATGSLEFNYIG